jgi:hypothetical protein
MAARAGLERYAPAFRDNDIEGEVLRSLTADDLRELGVASIGHRRRLLDAIARLVDGQTSAPASPAPGLHGSLSVCNFDKPFQPR